MQFLIPWKKNKPTALPWGGWANFDAEQKSKYPIRWFLFDTIPDHYDTLARKVRRVYWKIRHRFDPRHRYNILRTELEPGYYDPDTQILYACMHALKEYVEKAGPEICWDSSPEHEHAWAEMSAIYKWWTEEYPKYEDEEDALLNATPDINPEKLFGENCNEHDNDPDVLKWRTMSELCRELENEHKLKEEEMLLRLIKVRNFLWYP